MANLKTLASDSLVYGVSNVLGRFISYLLVPIHTFGLDVAGGEYGIITNIYAYTGVVLLVLVCGMETTYFNFVNKKEWNPNDVFATALAIVGTLCVIFLSLMFVTIDRVAPLMGYGDHHDYVLYMSIVTAMDALQAIAFTRMRQMKRSWRYAGFKLMYIFMSVILNTVFYIVLPYMATHFPSMGDMTPTAAQAFYSNLACTSIVSIAMWRDFLPHGGKVNRPLLRKMLFYTFPMLLVALGGQMTLSFDKIFFPKLYAGDDGTAQLGIYGACVKIASFMTLATTAYRLALEPLVFGNGKNGDKEDPQFLAKGTTAFVALLLVFFLGIMSWMDVLRRFIAPGYWEGIGVIWIVMLADIFYAIFFNFSFWYKKDAENPYWGALFSLVALALIAIINYMFVPRYSYYACAWACVVSWGVAMVLSYAIGTAKGHLKMPVGRLLLYGATAGAALALILNMPQSWSSWIRISLGTTLTLAFAAFAATREGLLAPIMKRLRH